MKPVPRIIWLASFPKSGNTWFRILLANLARDSDTPADINALEELGGLASSRFEFEAVTQLDSTLLSLDEIDALRPAVYAAIAEGRMDGEEGTVWSSQRAASPAGHRWIKVHDAYSHLADGTPLLGSNVGHAAVYIVRDPRDVAVSLSHHLGSTIDVAIRMMNDPDGTFNGSPKRCDGQLRQRLLGWSGHAESWMDQRDVPVVLVRYEDMRADPVGTFASALRHVGREATADAIARAVRHAEFSELQRQEGESGFRERPLFTQPFFRKGVVGDWRTRLSAEQVDAIERCHGRVMARLGYDCVNGRPGEAACA